MEFYDDLATAMKRFAEKGAFLTTKNADGVVNTMTIGWGFIGYSWMKPLFVTMVRPQRYTREIIEGADSFTVSIPFEDNMKKALAICGTKSGRDIDKEKEAGISFAPSQEVESPIVDGCTLYYECKIVLREKMNVDQLPSDMFEKYYDGDGHDLFYGEIVRVYKK